MNFLLARLKGRDSQIWKILSQQANLFTIPDLSHLHIFEPSYKLEDGEWFLLDNFSTLGFQNPLIGSTFNSTVLVQLPQDKYKNIQYFCCKQEEYYLFQKVTNSQIIRKPWINISGAPTIRYDEPIMCINGYIDAIYHEANDILYFKDINKIKDMFPGIETLYREATQQEVDGFIQSNPFISM